jgi:hypothetical protein
MEIVTVRAGLNISDLAKQFSTPVVAKIMARTLNREAAPIKTQIVNALTKQTGLKRGIVLKAVKEVKATTARLEYRLKTEGGFIRLKYFDPVEGGGGVTAKPRGTPTFYAGYYLTSGRPGNRTMAPKLNGQVYAQSSVMRGANRPGPWYSAIKLGRSDVAIPAEMVTGETAKAWQMSANRIGQRVAAEVLRQLLAGAT